MCIDESFEREMGKSRPLPISISANRIREFGSSQSLWDRAI